MKQKFTVTGMTCSPSGGIAAAGAPREFHLRGRSEFAPAPRFCLRQNACTRRSARALTRHAEQANTQKGLIIKKK